MTTLRLQGGNVHRSIKKLLLLNSFFVVILLNLVGCAPKVTTDQMHQGVSNGASLDALIQQMDTDEIAKKEMWYWLNLGRLHQMNGQHKESINSFAKAEKILEEYEDRAKVSARNVGSGTGSLLFSKGAETYYGKGYERTLMHTLNGLNYLMLNDFQNAAVEMRKMEKRQEVWLLESEKKIKEAHDESSKKKIEPGNSPPNYSMTEMLKDKSVVDMINNYQDPFSYGVSGFVCDLAGDADYAEVSLKRATKLLGEDNSDFFNTLLCSKRNSATNDDDIDVTIIVLGGLGPSLNVETIRLPVGGLNYTAIELPAYNKPTDDLTSVMVKTSSGESIKAKQLLFTDRLAYKTLSDEMPIEIVKAVTRATARGAVATAAGKDNQLAGLLASIVMDAVSSQMGQSFRNWEMLPNSGYLTKIRAKKGATITAFLNDTQQSMNISSKCSKGQIFLVSYLNPQTIRTSNVIY